MAAKPNRPEAVISGDFVVSREMCAAVHAAAIFCGKLRTLVPFATGNADVTGANFAADTKLTSFCFDSAIHQHILAWSPRVRVGRDR
jgi:hypothetical protein